MYLFIYALQTSSHCCGEGGVGCCLHTDPSPAMGLQKCRYLQQPPSGKRNALYTFRVSVHQSMHVHTVAALTFTKLAESK